MEGLMEDGELRKSTERLPPTDPKTAVAAVWDMDRMFELLATIDPEAAVHLG
jgi:hypothetical protein